jgi:hypothetical protein
MEWAMCTVPRWVPPGVLPGVTVNVIGADGLNKGMLPLAGLTESQLSDSEWV